VAFSLRLSGLAGADARSAAAHAHEATRSRGFCGVPRPGALAHGQGHPAFVREPAQWSQFLIFFGMLLVYFASMRTGTRGTSAAMWQSLVTLLTPLRPFSCSPPSRHASCFRS